MTQYEIGELDLTAQVSAAQSATNYIHADSSGINIYDSSLTNASKYYLRQTASGTYIYRNSYLKAKYEDTITLYGGSNVNGANPKVELTPDNFNIYDKDGKKRTTIDTSGLHIFDASSTPIEVALFGSTVGTTGTTAFARIGKSDSSRFEISPTTLSAYTGNTKYFEVSATGMTYGSFTAASTEDIDNIEIGGTNLLLGADFRNSASTVDVQLRTGSPSYADSNPSPPGYLGNGYAQTAGSGAPLQVKLGQAVQRAGLKYGDKVVLSAMIMSTEETEISVDISLYNANTNGSKTYGMMGDSSKQYASITLLPNVWTRVWCAFTINQTSMTAEEVYFGYRTAITGQVLRQSSYQLERGTKPTDWSLAKQDTANGALLDTEINQRKAAYGTSDTEASTDRKIVTISDFDKHEGAFLTVKFTNANTSTFPKLQINSQYWRDIYVGNAVGNIFWGAGAVITFKVVNDRFYIIDDGTINYMTCLTAADTASKILVNSNSNTPYVIFKGRKISVNFTYENTAANPTLKLEGVDRVLYAGSGSEKPTVENGLSWGNNSTQEFIYDGSYFRTADSGIARRSKILSDEAAKTATNYIEQTPSDGIKVVATNNSTTYVQITNSSIGMCQGGIEYIKLWENNNVPTIRIGHNIYGHTDITTDGLEIFDDTSSIAKFGTTTRIGKNNTSNIVITNSNIIGVSEDNSGTFFNFSTITDTTKRQTVQYNGQVLAGETKTFSSWRIPEGTEIRTTWAAGSLEIAYHIFTKGNSIIYVDNNYDPPVRIEYDGNSTFTSSIDISISCSPEIQASSFSLGANDANGAFSFAAGLGNIASGDNQTVLGKFNKENTTSAFIIGNGLGTSGSGTIREHSNALTIDWDGNIETKKVSVNYSSDDFIYHRMYNYDDYSNLIGYSEIRNDSTNSRIYRSFVVQNPEVSSNNNRCGMYFYVKNDGTRTAELINGVAWPIKSGGTGATTAADARTNLGLGDSGWKTLTLASGWTAYDTTQTPKYRKIGSLVEICGAVKPTATITLNDTATTFGTLPTGYRPAVNKFALCQASGVKSWLLGAYANGNVTAARLRAQNSTSYQTAATTEWLVFNIMYFVD